jgi:hypothetical protein
MSKVIKISFIINLIIIPIAFADICDFGYFGEYYTDRFGDNYIDIFGAAPDDIVCYGIVSETKTYNTPDGGKLIWTINPFLGDNCSKTSLEIVDKEDKRVNFFSNVKKDDYIVQITEDSVVKNVIYKDTPCDFILADTSSGNSTAFNFDGTENIKYHGCDKINKNLHEPVCNNFLLNNFAISQILECRKYKKYKEYIEKQPKCKTLFECTNKCRENVFENLYKCTRGCWRHSLGCLNEKEGKYNGIK